MSFNQGFSGPNMYGTYGAPMGGYTPNTAHVDQLYNTYKAMMENNPYFQQQQASQNGNPAMGQRGTFIQVKDQKEVDMYPVSPDGTPTLFFDFEHMVFWSKKFMNGRPCIQTFMFGPMNMSGDNSKEEQNTTNTEDNTKTAQTDNTLDILLDKINDMSKKINTLEKRTKKLQDSSSKDTKISSEDKLDELD